MNQDLLFILFFLLINFLCFFFGYLSNIKQQPNPIYFLKINISNIRHFLGQHYSRNSSDFFRVNLECSFFILLFKFIPIDTNLASHLIAAVSLWGLIYITYLFTIAFFFRRVPMIKADLSFIKVGLTLIKNKKYILIGVLFLILLMFYTLFFGISKVLMSLKVSNVTYLIIIIGIVILGFKRILSYPFRIYHYRGVLAPTIHLIKNLINSQKYASILNFNVNEVLSKNIYSDIILTEKPEIVIISIESFGSIAYKDEDIYEGIKKVLEKYQNQFSDKDIHIASSYSTAPQYGGGSWLCVGSLIYGYKIEDDVQYHAIFKHQSNFRRYKSMIHYFKDQGYDANMIATLGGYDEFEVDWEKVKNVYPMDTFIKWDDLEYRGQTLDFMNSSYSPPDQYSLWKGMEIINSNTSKPKISLFTTLNSHCNWHSPVRLEDDYKTLNIIKNFETTTQIKKPRKENYTSSIAYQLEVVFDYVNKNPNKIYIIFGDHQPPYITSDTLGFETPLFVLSKNHKLIDGLRKEGFQNDLINFHHTIRHEGFYSLFMKSFLQVYSKSKDTLPVFPDGIKFEKKVQN